MTSRARQELPTRGEQLAVMHARLTAAVEELVNGEAWQRMLRIAALLPRYSPSNILLIAAQRPEATRVMGYRAWTQNGRNVVAGEKGIAILAPCTYRETKPEVPAPDGVTLTAGETAERVLRGYRVVHVFDITQTTGKELADEPQLLRGEAPERLYEGLARLIAADGFTLVRGDCRGANGYTDFVSRTIHVRDDIDPAQAVKTLTHELGHVRADHGRRFLDPTSRTLSCRGAAEVEAESIAYLVGWATGLDTASYSVPYIAGWSGGDASVLREAATQAVTVALAIDQDLLIKMQPPATVLTRPEELPPPSL